MGKLVAYIGTYTNEEHDGIYIYNVDEATGRLQNAGIAPKIDNASYLIVDKNNKYLYSVIETEEFNGENGGAVAAFSIDKNTGMLNLLNVQPTKGKAPCHLCVDKEHKNLYTANYNEGTASVFPLNIDGSIAPISQVIEHKGQGPNKERQEKPHVHFVKFAFDEKYLCVVDLGIDSVVMYDVDKSSRTLTPDNNLSVKIKAGSGPRHLEFHPEGKYLYVINELSSDIVVLKYCKEDNKFEEVQTISTLSEEYNGTSYSAAIAISSDGNFLYASNRGDDSIAAYKIDKATGMLTLIAHYSSQGKWPRDIKIDPTGNYVYAANQNSDSVACFKVNKSGELKFLESIKVQSPVCITFVQLAE